MDDMGLKLKCLRELRDMTQKDLARASSVGEKTLSSFETGMRIKSLKLSQLEAILAALGTTLVEFLLWSPETTSAPMPAQPIEVTLPPVVQLTARRAVVDPLAGVRRESDHPTPQSPLSYAV